ncbi:MAG: flotillin-like protein FloA [Desulfamplus sp.]|nr:flotillin-like protein FloA [Desulfamplus sp.]
MDFMFILALIAGVIGLAVFYLIFSYITLWIQALVSGAKVGLVNIIFMRFRKVPAKLIVESKIMAVKAGMEIPTDSLESHFLAGGNVSRVIQALIAADKANIALTFNRASAIDLAGRDVLEAVQMSVNPKVIETPLVAAMAKDGIQLKAISRVTVRANIDRLVGGAGAETILARVGEGIVTTIGSAETHKKVLENPDMISKTVLKKGLDAGTAYEILSIDIADVDVGKNIGAELETDRAEADKKIAQAKAEEKRAMAHAQEQEMKARVQEMRAKVVEAEAQVPLAMAEAFRSGNLGIMDYYKMQNISADTKMRDQIANPESYLYFDGNEDTNR